MSHHASWDLVPATGGVWDKHAHSWYPTKHGTALPGKWSWRPESFTGRARLQSQYSTLKLARHLDGQDHFNSLEISISLRGEEHFWRSRWTQAVPGNPLAFPLEPLEKCLLDSCGYFRLATGHLWSEWVTGESYSSPGFQPPCEISQHSLFFSSLLLPQPHPPAASTPPVNSVPVSWGAPTGPQWLCGDKKPECYFFLFPSTLFWWGDKRESWI